MKRHLQALYAKWHFDDRLLKPRATAREIAGRFWPGKREVRVFLQLDDPYSYLLSHYLRTLAPACERRLTFRYYLCASLGGKFQSHPNWQVEYALRDCRMLARALNIPFLDVANEPAEALRRPLMDYLVAEHEAEFPEAFLKAMELFWRGDAAGIETLMGQHRGDPADTNVLVGKNQLLLRKSGHYQAATIQYDGQWYAGVDRLAHFLERIIGQRRCADDEAAAILDTLSSVREIRLPAGQPAMPAARPALEMFYSFRSPYSYLALQDAFDIADAYGLELKIRPLLPMVERGVALPRAKARYILADAKREAQQRELPFASFADPLGKGVENCLAGLLVARHAEREHEFLLAVAESVFVDGRDLSTAEGMAEVAEIARIDSEAMASGLQNDNWRVEVDANASALAELELWGVPTFRFGGFSCWGQDRTWLLARVIEGWRRAAMERNQ